MRIELNTAVSLSYDIYGPADGPVVVLVPGQHQAVLFEHMQVPQLVKAGYRVVTYDHRGVAPSEETPPPYSMEGLADDLAALAEALELGQCSYVGYSLGAMVILELSMRRPGLILRGALVGVPWKPSALQLAIRNEAVQRLNSDAVLSPTLEGIYRALYLFGPRALNRDAFIRPYLEQFQGIGEDGRHGAIGHADASVNYAPTAEQVSRIEVPLLIVGMEHDIVAPRDRSQELAKLIPTAAYTEIRNCGHAALLEKPTELNTLLAGYLSSGEVAPPRRARAASAI
jgi:pimeloyl-ACP methyl ester carboxylesterase